MFLYFLPSSQGKISINLYHIRDISQTFASALTTLYFIWDREMELHLTEVPHIN